MKALLLMVSLTLSTQPSLASINDIDAAANTMDVLKLSQLAEQSYDYQQAYAHYRLAITANVLGQKTQVAESLLQARQTLESVNSIEASADSLALLASVYGMQIALDSSKGTTLGMKSAALLQQAEQLDAQNPRVWLIKAISAFHTPSTYGGGMTNAQTYADKAIALYQRPCDSICWGHAEAYTWRGLTKQEQGDIAGAQQDWTHAITIDKHYGWAKFLLSNHTVKQ